MKNFLRDFYKKISLVVIAVISISVIFFGFFKLIEKNLSYYLSLLDERVEIVAFLEDKLAYNQQDELLKSITDINTVDKIKYTSKNEALEEFKKNQELINRSEFWEKIRCRQL